MSKPKEANWDIQWEPRDGGGEPQCSPNPAYPKGKDIDISAPELSRCRGELPYVMWPERGLGILMVTCLRCGVRTAITTAGRPDDPISLTQNCEG
jgi:hypothetical protein